ncbi:SDR family NAD(P)-dependent oxidoreductase [Alkalihalobacillus macyae]|uniref:SDR family NAD(P)-dependent oxidoreductase n=1 Tax=Guptibacillus hwajinpoensis TaxID=208199 RepID=UPI00273BF1B0|nr:SDR family NAD(P)-dependent oxidoreductase [Alkalihalobacillus macyae]MDP4549650.1 SDR family NAD(P)-dependent oxidoreductase [Alkalihalobacillus macyae]
MKTLVIVGAGPGISLHTAMKFGEQGFTIALVARRQEALDQYAEELKAKNIEVETFVADATNPEDLTEAMNHIHNTLGHIDGLLYNAASGTPGKPTTLTATDLTRDFKINVGGALSSVQSALPHMKEGFILLTGGGLALQPYADYSSLAIGKAGIRNLAYSLHDELQPKGIYVGTLTIKGFVKEGTSLAPNHVAEAFYMMYENQSEVESDIH